MTAPYTGFEAQWGAGSPLAQREWDDFNKRHKELVEAILGAASDPGIHQLTQQQVQPQAPVMQQPDSPFGPPRPAARDELIAQARFWGIANPESMDQQELQLRIQQMRAEMPRDQQTSLGSASLAALGLASEAGGATALPWLGSSIGRRSYSSGSWQHLRRPKRTSLCRPHPRQYPRHREGQALDVRPEPENR
jgi:hypothetical protein